MTEPPVPRPRLARALRTAAIAGACGVAAYACLYGGLRWAGIFERWPHPVSGNRNFIWVSYGTNFTRDHVRRMDALQAVFEPLIKTEMWLRNARGARRAEPP
jgi:hypothetical protein